MMWTVENPIGRLVEARLSTSDGQAVRDCLGAIAAIAEAASAPLVGVFDLSRVLVLGRAEADLLLGVMRDYNRCVERAAYVVNGNPLLDMQIERLIRSADAPRRRVFRFASQAVHWLSECLTEAEAAHALGFLTL